MSRHVLSLRRTRGDLYQTVRNEDLSSGKPDGDGALRLSWSFASHGAGKRVNPMVVDSFTKWVECVSPLKKTAKVRARATINILFSQCLGILSRFSRMKAVPLRMSSFTRSVRYG